jgi:hypothetical protein
MVAWATPQLQAEVQRGWPWGGEAVLMAVMLAREGPETYQPASP